MPSRRSIGDWRLPVPHLAQSGLILPQLAGPFSPSYDQWCRAYTLGAGGAAAPSLPRGGGLLGLGGGGGTRRPGWRACSARRLGDLGRQIGFGLGLAFAFGQLARRAEADDDADDEALLLPGLFGRIGEIGRRASPDRYLAPPAGADRSRSGASHGAAAGESGRSGYAWGFQK
jgi:hypothetical protein